MANERYLQFASDPDFGAVMVVWQDDSFDRADAAYCRQIRQRFGLTMPVVVYTGDDEAARVGLDQRHVHIVSRRGARIEHRAQFDDSTWGAQVERLLAE